MKERTVHALLHSIVVISFCDFYKSFGNSVLSKIHITLKLYVHCASHQTQIIVDMVESLSNKNFRNIAR